MKISPKVDRAVTAVCILVLALAIGLMLQVVFAYKPPVAPEWPKQSESWPVFEPWVPVQADECPASLISDLEDPCKRAAVAP